MCLTHVYIRRPGHRLEHRVLEVPPAGVQKLDVTPIVMIEESGMEIHDYEGAREQEAEGAAIQCSGLREPVRMPRFDYEWRYGGRRTHHAKRTRPNQLKRHAMRHVLYAFWRRPFDL